jgi:hypothetical protein
VDAGDGVAGRESAPSRIIIGVLPHRTTPRLAAAIAVAALSAAALCVSAVGAQHSDSR